MRAYNTAGDSGYSNVASVTVIAKTPSNPPVDPSNLTATAVSNTQVDLAWTDNSTNENGFKIERSTDGTNFTEIATVAQNVTSYSDTKLLSPGTYYYRVRAYNSAGDSGYSNVVKVTI